MNLVIENNENCEVCKRCGGKCCQNMGCEVSTADFLSRYGKITKETVITALNDGEWAIDWWEGDIREDDNYKELCAKLPEFCVKKYRPCTYYMRTRHVGESAVCPSWGGTCVMWSAENGCRYDWEHRPTGGKALPVGASRYCPRNIRMKAEHREYGKPECVVDWFLFYDILAYAAREYKEESQWNFKA